jgi:hypothetical protein
VPRKATKYVLASGYEERYWHIVALTGGEDMSKTRALCGVWATALESVREPSAEELLGTCNVCAALYERGRKKKKKKAQAC